MFYFKQKAFGLIEVIVVVAIFLMCLAAIISITGLSYKNLQKNETRWKAVTLAQNIIDQARNTRDNNVMQDLPWSNGLTTSVAKYYDFDMNECPGGVCSGVLTYRVSAVGHIYPSNLSMVYVVQVDVTNGSSFTYKSILKDYSSIL